MPKVIMYCEPYFSGRSKFSKCLHSNVCCKTCPSGVESCPILKNKAVLYPCHLFPIKKCPYQITEGEMAMKLLNEKVFGCH